MSSALEEAQEAARLIAEAEKLLSQADEILQPLAKALMIAGDVDTLETIGDMLPLEPYGRLFGGGAYQIREGNIPPGLRPALTMTSPAPTRVVWSDTIIDRQRERHRPVYPRDMASIGTIISSYHVAGFGPKDPGTTYYDVEWAYQRTPDKTPEITKEKGIPYFNLSAIL
jgi:hypothetical protein